MRKMLRDGRKKSLCGWSCLSWCDSESSAPPCRAQTPPPPRAGPCTCRHTANLSTLWACVPPAISNTGVSQELDYFPNHMCVTTHAREHKTHSRAPPGTWLKGKADPRKGGQSPLPDHSHHKPTNYFLKHSWEQGGTDSWLQTYLTSCTVQLGKPPCTLYPDFLTKLPAKELYPKGILGYVGSKHN